MEKMHVYIKDIIPQQHYLCEEKLETSKSSFEEYDTYGDIYVIKYKDLLFSIDGHHRLYHLIQKGVKTIDVLNDPDDNSHFLYQILADEALKLGYTSVLDLPILNKNDYEIKWIGKCQKLLKSKRSDCDDSNN